MRVLLGKIAGLLRRGRLDAELDEEVEFHLAMLADRFEREGMDPKCARQAATRHFGGVMQLKESYRDQRGLPGVEMFLQDARYGARTLLRTPAFTLAALLTLALGIGANTAIFSVVNAVLLRPLPYPDPERLVQLVWKMPTYEAGNHDGLRYLFFRDHLRSVEALAAQSGGGSFNLVVGDRAEFVNALVVSEEYFTVFGVTPVVGRPFAREHDRSGGPDVAIISHALWDRYFASDPAVVGRSILLGDRSFTVLGVLPAAFDPGVRADVLLPLRPSTSGRGGGFNYSVTGRLRSGTTIQQASAEAGAVWQAFAEAHPKALMRDELPTGFVPLQESRASSIRPALLMMLAAVGLLLLIACANTASLLLARASGRTREVAVRAALGAPRGRIVRQLLTESVLLALAGAALGVLLAYWSVPALLSVAPPAYLLVDRVTIDATVLFVALGVAASTGLVFGLVPAFSLSRVDLVDAFKDDGGRTTAGRRAGLMRKALVVTEVALCTLLLIGAGLLIQTFVRLRAVDPGFNPRGVLTASMSMQGERYSEPQDLNRFYEEGLERIRRIAGVRSAAVTNGLPLVRALNLNVDVLDWPEGQGVERVRRALTDWRYVTPDYFQTMRISVVEGRAFTSADRRGAPPAAVVSEEFARRFFKGTSAIGRHIRVFDDDGALQIVGVVKDLKEGGLKTRPVPVMYVPVAQTHAVAIKTTHSYFQVHWVVRAENAGADLPRQIEEAIRGVDPRQPVSSFRTMDELKNSAMATERFQMTLLGAFAGIGLLLAAAGIYGLIAYSVAQRTREFGIRVALGATGGRILRQVVGVGALLGAIGVAAGSAAAYALSRTVAGFVWGVSPSDPATYALVAVLLVVVTVVASLVPARRAVHLNAVAALRE